MSALRVGQAVRLVEEDEGPLTEPYGVGRVTEIYDSSLGGQSVTVYWPKRGHSLVHSPDDLRPARG